MHWTPRRLADLAVACVVLSFLVWTEPVQAQIFSCGTTSLGTYRWQASGQLTRANTCQGFRGFRCHPVENPSWSVDKTDPACEPEAGSCVVEIHARATIPGLKDMIMEEGSPSLSPTPWAEWYPCAGAGYCFVRVKCECHNTTRGWRSQGAREGEP